MSPSTPRTSTDALAHCQRCQRLIVSAGSVTRWSVAGYGPLCQRCWQREVDALERQIAEK